MNIYKTSRDKKVVFGYSALVVGLTAIMAIVFMVEDSFGRLLFFGLLFMIGMIYFVGGMVFITYELKEEGLFVQAGLISRFYSYESMTALEPMGSPFSGKERIVGSSQGFNIKHNGPKGEVKVSPERMEEFKQELLKRAPHLDVQVKADSR